MDGQEAEAEETEGAAERTEDERASARAREKHDRPAGGRWAGGRRAEGASQAGHDVRPRRRRRWRGRRSLENRIEEKHTQEGKEASHCQTPPPPRQPKNIRETHQCRPPNSLRGRTRRPLQPAATRVPFPSSTGAETPRSEVRTEMKIDPCVCSAPAHWEKDVGGGGVAPKSQCPRSVCPTASARSCPPVNHKAMMRVAEAAASLGLLAGQCPSPLRSPHSVAGRARPSPYLMSLRESRGRRRTESKSSQVSREGKREEAVTLGAWDWEGAPVHWRDVKLTNCKYANGKYIRLKYAREER